MSDEFEWQTDVEVGWDEFEATATGPTALLSRRVKLVVLMVFACIVIGAASVIYATLDRRVGEAEAIAETAAIVAHRLLNEAVLEADMDVFETLVAARPSSWRALQLDLLSQSPVFGRRPLGIEPDASAGTELISFSMAKLSLEMTVAEIADRRPYVVSSAGVPETVVLERSFLYENRAGQWLLVPPADEREYWGNWARDERNNLVLVYPTRDEGVALRLSRDLEGFVANLCGLGSVACPKDFRLEFKLEIDPTSVRRLGEGLYPIRTGSAAVSNRLTLPTPSLLGRPMDESGYQAILRGYASWIGAAIVAGYGTPEALASGDAAADVLAELGLEPPPPPVEPLPRSSLSGFPVGAPVPQQDVMMLCSGQSRLRLLRFRPENGRWYEEIPVDRQPVLPPLEARQGSYLSRLPDYRTALIQVAGGDGQETMWSTYLWQQGVIRLLAEDQRPHFFFPPTMQPPEQPYMKYLAFYAPSTTEGSRAFTGLGLDLVACATAPCELELLDGMPVWSPDGQRTVVHMSRGGGGYTLHLGDAKGEAQSQIGEGQSATWLDDDRLAYVAIDPGAAEDSFGRRFGESVSVISIKGPDGTDWQSYVLFEAETLREALPESIRPDAMVIWSAQPALQEDEWWFVLASSLDFSDPQHFMFVYSPQTGQARVAADMSRFRHLESLIVSPRGRFAVISGITPDGDEASFELLDALTGDMMRLENSFPTDWTADEAWLMQVARGKLHLTLTETGQQWPIVHDLDGCYWAVWMDGKTDTIEE